MPPPCSPRTLIGLLAALVALGCTARGAEPERPRDGGSASPDGGSSSPRDAALPGRDASCETLTLRSRPGTSNVLVVLDRSSSMYREAGLGLEGVDRWTPAVSAIRTVTGALDDRVQFGLMLFASPDAPAGMSLCGAGRVDVAPAPGTATAIAAELTGDPGELTGSWTPTAVSLQAAREALAGLEGRSYVLLVTDGAPNCNDALDPDTCRYAGNIADNPRLCIDADRTVAAIDDLREAGISTFVVGYDTSEWADVLDRMAAAGGTERTTHVPVGDEASLRDALESIAGSVVSCTVELEEAPHSIHFVRVSLDGTDVLHESVATEGGSWRLVGERQVELRGRACEVLRDGGEHELRVTRECVELF